MDRFAAFLVDIQAVALITTAVNAPVRLIALEWGILQNEAAATAASLSALALFWITAVVYETFAVLFVGGTFGKILFALDVVGPQIDVPLPWHITLRRSALKWSSFFWILPVLGILSDSKRRTLYDRAYDTDVLKFSSATSKSTEAPSAEFLPSHREKRLAGGVAAGVWVVIALLLGLITYEVSTLVRGQVLAPRRSSLQGLKLCTQDANKLAEQKEFGIDEALMAYSLDLIDEKCLEEVTSQILIRAKDKGYLSDDLTAKTYLARSFVHFRSPDLSDEYLGSICITAPDSEVCSVAELISTQAEVEGVDLNGPIPEALSASLERAKQHSALGKLWALQFKLRHSDYLESLEILDELQTMPLASWLSTAFAEKRVQVLMGMTRLAEAEQVLLTVASSLEQRQFGVLSRGLCLERLAETCESLQSVSCKESAQTLDDRSTRGELPDALRWQISECRKELGLPQAEDIEVEAEPVLQVIQAHTEIQNGKRKKALDLLYDAYSKATTGRLERQIVQTALKWIRSSQELSAWSTYIREHRREPQIRLALIELKESTTAPRSSTGPSLRLPASEEDGDSHADERSP